MAGGPGAASRPRGAVAAVLRWFDSVTSITTGLLIYIACVFMFAMVVTRYLFAYSDPSVEIIARYLMIWATFIGVSCAVRTGSTIRFTLVERMLRPRARRIFVAAGHAVAMAICGAVAWSGIELVDETMMFNEVIPTALRWPVWIFRLSVAVGAVLLCLQFLRAIIEGVNGQSHEGPGV